VFENRVLGRIFGSKWEEVVVGWRRLDNEELHNLYISPTIIRVIKSRWVSWGMTCSMDRRDEKCIQYFGLKT